ncbi:hypothetical protein B0J18DRAFT_1472 [Chaetomium sp. MPI-SDFR-AT-0129]|nr:hypothetical protein B0J18DRAFT_1472 [Chaetomium sp. MPI-SDFR-AT-0129]
MRALQKLFTRATPRQIVPRRSPAIFTHLTRNKSSQATPSSPSATPSVSNGTRVALGPNLTSHFTTLDRAQQRQNSTDDRARGLYSTQIYHGQARPSPSSSHPCRRAFHSSARALSPVHVAPGPATGADTGVPIAAQMFGSEVKGNPTESEADVAADRSDADPLPPGKHHTIRLGPGDAAPRPTESEEDVAADRGGNATDPLGGGKKVR